MVLRRRPKTLPIYACPDCDLLPGYLFPKPTG